MDFTENMTRKTFAANHATVDIQPSAVTVMSPCAACKILRRRCGEKCVLAPYFPPTEPLKFIIAHRVFGASNIIKFLQELPEYQRCDAVNSMVYEANARLRDPVYGCAGVISQLQNQISELQSQLAKSQAETLNAQSRNANLLDLIVNNNNNNNNNSKENMALHDQHAEELAAHELVPVRLQHDDGIDENNTNFFVDVRGPPDWDPLWT